MAAPIPLRGDFDASQLRGLARKTKDGPQARRLLALAAIYDGATRNEAAKIGGVGLQIIRDWVLRFNARGSDGLLDGKSPGQPSCATIGSQITCSNPTTISSAIAAMLGTSSSISLGRSCPSDCANGRTGSDQWDLV